MKRKQESHNSESGTRPGDGERRQKKRKLKKNENEGDQHLFVVPIDAMELLLSERIYNAEDQEAEFAKVVDEMRQRIVARNEAVNLINIFCEDGFWIE